MPNASSYLSDLQVYLSKPIVEEAHVTHILSLVRKTIETYRKSGSQTCYAALYFFCHWALHTQMDKNAYISTFVGLFDLTDGLDFPAYFRTEFFQEMMYFRQFKLDLRQFLTDHNLPDSVTTSNDGWANFVYLYSGLISGSSLTGKNGLPHSIEKIEVVKLPRKGSVIDLIHWTITIPGRPPFTSAHMYPVRRLVEDRLYSLLSRRMPSDD
jgi:hypothetical protein